MKSIGMVILSFVLAVHGQALAGYDEGHDLPKRSHMTVVKYLLLVTHSYRL